MKRFFAILLAALVSVAALADGADVPAVADAVEKALGRGYGLTELFDMGEDEPYCASASVTGIKDVVVTFAYFDAEGSGAYAMLLESDAADHGEYASGMIAAPEDHEEAYRCFSALVAALAPEEEDPESVVKACLSCAEESGFSPYYAFFGGEDIGGAAEGEHTRVIAGEWEFGIYATLDLLAFSARPAGN